MSNVVPLPIDWDPRVEALAEARRYQPGDFDRLLAAAASEPAMPDTTPLIDGLAAQGRAVWLRRDAEAGREQAIAWAVRLEQQIGEIEHLARQWAGMKSGVVSGIGHNILDILSGDYDAA
jgi:hypothetical protein